MAVTRMTDKTTPRLRLNNGTSAEGKLLTVTTALPALAANYSASGDAALMAVATAISPCLTKSVYSTELAVTYTLVD